MSRYTDNFDEFGNLREDHSPWRFSDLASVFAIVLVIVLLTSGVLA
jgi:hypothetical protein